MDFMHPAFAIDEVVVGALAQLGFGYYEAANYEGRLATTNLVLFQATEIVFRHENLKTQCRFDL